MQTRSRASCLLNVTRSDPTPFPSVSHLSPFRSSHLTTVFLTTAADHYSRRGLLLKIPATGPSLKRAHQSSHGDARGRVGEVSQPTAPTWLSRPETCSRSLASCARPCSVAWKVVLAASRMKGAGKNFSVVSRVDVPSAHRSTCRPL